MTFKIKQDLRSYYKKIIIILILLGSFHVLANLIVYSIAGQEHFYTTEFMVGTIWGGLYKALTTLPTAFMIPIILLIIIYIDWKNVDEFKYEKKSYSDSSKIVLIALFIIFCFLSIPWILAIVGIYVSNIPLLNLIFLGQQFYQGHPAVHLGDHHGFGGWFFVTTVWILMYTRLLDKIQKPWIKKFIVFAFSFILYYSLILVLEDGFNEQLAKRGNLIGIYLYVGFSYLYQIQILIPSALIVGFCTLLIWNKYYS